MEMEEGYIIADWKIENLNHWCAEVHGECIQSPKFNIRRSDFFLELYPKGSSGKGKLPVVCIGGIAFSISGDISFYCTDGSLLCQQSVNAKRNAKVELYPGPKFEGILSRTWESEDFTIRFRVKDSDHYQYRLCTTLNVVKISLQIKPGWIETMKSDERKEVFHIGSTSSKPYLDNFTLETYSENNAVDFTIKPPIICGYPFAVEVCMRLARSDGTVDSCVRKEHVFRDNIPWIFPDPLDKKKLVGKEISLFFCLTQRDWIHSSSYESLDNRSVIIEPNNKICFYEVEPSTDPITSNKDPVAVLTKDFGSQIYISSEVPDGSIIVLSKELMCLYQDQKFSDLELKCDNVTFPVHKAILSSRSPVLDRLLSCDMKEASSGIVDIGDLDPSTLGLFLTYLYTGVVEGLQSDRALKLYYAADKYQVPSLKTECVKFLGANVVISNVCDILSLADRHNDDQLISAAHNFILKSYNEVMKSNEWESLMHREPFLAAKTLTHFAAKDRVRMHDLK